MDAYLKDTTEHEDGGYTPEEFVTSLDKYMIDWQKKHPLLHKFDLLFKNESIGHYRASYILLHPWKLLMDGFREIKYAWQRVFKGYDERVIWSIDGYIAEMLPTWLAELKVQKQGVPSMFFKPQEDEYVDENGTLCIKEEAMERARKEYDAVLDKIIAGFYLYNENDGEFFNKPFQEKIFNEGMALFVKYFGTFWD